MDDLRPSFAALTGLPGPAASTSVNMVMVRKVSLDTSLGKRHLPSGPA